MKIYFEDGPLNEVTINAMYKNGYIIDAANGISHNIEELNALNEHEPDALIYTNQVAALDNRFAWNKEGGVPEIYLRRGMSGFFARIDIMTQRELRFAHNIMKMYMAGEFK